MSLKRQWGETSGHARHLLRCCQEDKTPPGYLWTPIPGFIQNTIPHTTVAYDGGMLRSVEHTALSPGPMSRRRDHALVFCSHVKAPICRQALRGHCSRGRGEAGLVVMLPWWPEHVFTHVTLVGSVIISFASLKRGKINSSSQFRKAVFPVTRSHALGQTIPAWQKEPMV